MNVRITFLLLTPLLAAGCAMQPRRAQSPSRPAPPVVVAAVLPTKVVETRYEVRGYRDAANPSLRHEAHALYRRTRVPLSASDELATAPRSSFPLASVAPLPASEELSAELTTQRKITAELRAMQAALADAEKQMRAQYALLVRQSAETMQVRGELETERARVRSELPLEAAPSAPAGTTSATPDVKW
jgi:hypothetical protein